MEKDKISEIKEIVEKHPFTYSKIIKSKPNLLNYIISKTPLLNDSVYKLSTKIYWILHDMTEFPRCIVCNKEIKTNLGLSKKISRYCSYKCSGRCKERIQKVKNTCLEKYGDENFVNAELAKETKLKRYGNQNYNNISKIQKTNIEKYNAVTPLQNELIKKKSRQTSLERYNNSYFNNREKFKKSCFDKYGCENPMQNIDIQEKIKKTNLEKYGVENVFQRADVKEKTKKTNLERYGSEKLFSLDEIKEKIKKTNLERYGCEYPSQNRDIRLKQQAKYFYDNKNFDSSPEIALYIYLLDHNIDFEYQPDIKFEYLDKDSKLHYYFPDFRIEDKFYEIKGDHFFDENNKMINPYDRSQDILYEFKQKCMISNNVIILRSKDYQKYLDYIEKTYGKDYLKQFKNK